MLECSDIFLEFRNSDGSLLYVPLAHQLRHPRGAAFHEALSVLPTERLKVVRLGGSLLDLLVLEGLPDVHLCAEFFTEMASVFSGFAEKVAGPGTLDNPAPPQEGPVCLK